MDGQQVKEQVTLPDLAVVILQAGEKIRLINIPDPREMLIRQLNLEGKEFGVTAEVA
jgi:hypothetical protein